ncbi:MAG: DUF58 domain-containing protein [Planctomycetota bacterium]|nr:MAG: DUF58 domain-containing protein [Planctomycetota bacterium]
MSRIRPKNASADAGLDPVARRAALSVSGFIFVGLTVFLAVGAVNSQNNLLFWVFGVAIGGVIVSGVVSGTGLMGVRLIAHDPGPAEADRPTQLHYTLVSRNRWLPVFAIELREVSMPKGGRGVCLPRLGPGDRVGIEAEWIPQKRGVFTLDRILVETRFPFGLMHKTLEFSKPRVVVVGPARIEIRTEVIRQGDRGVSTGQVRRARRGWVGDYYGLREYAQGDPRRTISWRASARRGSLLVVEHGEPPGSSLWVWVTAPDPANADGAIYLERAFSVVLALVRSGSLAGRDVGVWVPWAGIRLPPARGPAFEARVADALARVDPDARPTPDSRPQISGADRILILPLFPPATTGEDEPRLDLSRPEDWLAPGEALPPSLRFPSGVGS